MLFVDNKLRVGLNNNNPIVNSPATLPTNKWIHVGWTYDKSNLRLYINGTEVNSISHSTSIDFSASKSLGIGAERVDSSPQGYLNGQIDEVKIYSKALNTTEVKNLYNNGNISDSGSTSPPPTEYFDITVVDNETSASINTFNVTIDGTSYSTTNGTINTGINQSLGNVFDVEIWGINNHFDKTYLDYNTSDDLSADILEYPKITIFDNETSASLDIFNVSLVGYFANTTNGTIYFPYQTTKTININSPGYNEKTITHNFENSTELNQNLLYTFVRMSIQGFEAPSNSTQINNFTIIAESLNSSFSVNSSTSNGTLNVEYIRDETLNLTFDSSLYALTSSLLSPSYDYTFNFSSYPTNSVYIYIYSGTELIDDRQINITLNGGEYQVVSTTNGTYKFDNIVSGAYQIDLVAPDFSDNTYYFTLTNRTHRELDLYMSATCSDVTFSILDTYQSALDGVVATFNQQINGSWVDIGQRTTDISGEIQICLESDPHLIQASKTGYETWEGTLTPLNSEYTIFLDILGARVYDTLFGDVTYIYEPTSQVLNGNKTNFTLTTYSPGGQILYFGLNCSYNGSSYIDNVTTFASGGVASIELPLKQDDDNEFSINFFVHSVNGNSHSFKVTYQVYDYAISQYSLAQIFEDWKADEGDLPVLFWTYIFIFVAMALLYLSGARGLILLVAAMVLIGVFSSPLIAAINLTIGLVQIVLLVLIAIAMSKRGYF